MCFYIMSILQTIYVQTGKQHRYDWRNNSNANDIHTNGQATIDGTILTQVIDGTILTQVIDRTILTQVIDWRNNCYISDQTESL